MDDDWGYPYFRKPPCFAVKGDVAKQNTKISLRNHGRSSGSKCRGLLQVIFSGVSYKASIVDPYQNAIVLTVEIL